MLMADMLTRIVEVVELLQSSLEEVVEPSLEEEEVHSFLLVDRKLEDTLEGSHNQDQVEEVRSRQDMLLGRSAQSQHYFSAFCLVEARKDNQSKQMVAVVRIQPDCSSLDRMR
jgi:hypothetical protein